ncbi:MAG: tandem-95 repeat protein, partial [Actinomycetia bacterium]|nr:tandem-95 repeat protein [Actinomycetes bacterium]
AGAWNFTANSAFDSLNVGDNVNETFNVSSVDGTASTVAITINGTNDGPVATADTGTTAEGATLSVAAGSGVLTNDTDLDGNTLSVSEVEGNAADVGSQITLASGALLTLNADGSYDYDPNGQFETLGVGDSTTDAFAYTIIDGQGGTDTATVTLTITGTNDGPVAVDDANTTLENTPVSSTLDLQSNDTDIDGDSLAVDATSVGTFTTTQGGTIVVAADGGYTYNPATNFNGTDTFDYTVTDGTLTDTGTLTISVGAVNDDPVAADDTGTVTEDATLTVNAINGVIQDNDTDVDGDSLVVAAIRTGTESGSGTSGSIGSGLVGTYGTLTINNNGSYTYVADQVAADALADGATATDTFTYTASDGKGGTDTAEIAITINGTNDAATVSTASQTLAETDAALTASGTLTATDVDNPDDTFTP